MFLETFWLMIITSDLIIWKFFSEENLIFDMNFLSGYTRSYRRIGAKMKTCSIAILWSLPYVHQAWRGLSKVSIQQYIIHVNSVKWKIGCLYHSHSNRFYRMKYLIMLWIFSFIFRHLNDLTDFKYLFTLIVVFIFLCQIFVLMCYLSYSFHGDRVFGCHAPVRT